MALRSKALHRLCQSLWRVNVSGSSRPGEVLLHPSAPCGIQRWSSSLSQHPHPPPPNARTSSSPPPPTSTPCLPAAKEGSFSISLHKNLHIAGAAGVGADSHTARRKKADTGTVAVSSGMTGVSMCTDVTSNPQTRHHWDLASWPGAEHMEYICPSEKLTTLPELVILEQQLPHTVSYDLPQTSNIAPQIIDPTTSTSITEISEPTDRGREAPKEAREIMKIRRRKMKRHLLKRFRKRMTFTLRKIRLRRRRKKEAVFQARLAKIRDWGDKFDAKDWVEDQLNRARRGGFYINPLKDRDRQR